MPAAPTPPERPEPPAAPGELLRLEGLKVVFDTEDGVLPAVQGVDLSLREGETLGLVGESGCGKTVTALSVLRLLPEPPARITGKVWLRGRDLLALPERDLHAVRGGEVGMVFQEPMSSLNPVVRVGDQVAEAVALHQDLGVAGRGFAARKERRRQALRRAAELLDRTGIPDPERVAGMYPHELSGGMRQRVMIAMALSCRPGLLIADEPTTALDVTIQAQILDLMAGLQRDMGTSVLLITHHLGVVAEFCQRAAVMYAGSIVEEAPTRDLFREPLHPYTQGLLASIPDPTRPAAPVLSTIEGRVPDLRDPPPGCRFEPRCPARMAICRAKVPALVEVKAGHKVACFLHHREGPEANPREGPRAAEGA